MGLIMNGNSGKKYIFEGPFDFEPYLDDVPAVFAILSVNGKEFELLDLGGSEILYRSIYNVDRLMKKSDKYSHKLKYAAFYNWNSESTLSENITKDIKEFYKL